MGPRCSAIRSRNKSLGSEGRLLVLGVWGRLLALELRRRRLFLWPLLCGVKVVPLSIQPLFIFMCLYNRTSLILSAFGPLKVALSLNLLVGLLHLPLPDTVLFYRPVLISHGTFLSVNASKPPANTPATVQGHQQVPSNHPQRRFPRKSSLHLFRFHGSSSHLALSVYSEQSIN